MITAILTVILFLVAVCCFDALLSLILIALIYGWQAAEQLALGTYDRALRWLVFRLFWRMTRRGRWQFVVDFTNAIVAEYQEGQ